MRFHLLRRRSSQQQQLSKEAVMAIDLVKTGKRLVPRPRSSDDLSDLPGVNSLASPMSYAGLSLAQLMDMHSLTSLGSFAAAPPATDVSRVVVVEPNNCDAHSQSFEPM